MMRRGIRILASLLCLGILTGCTCVEASSIQSDGKNHAVRMEEPEEREDAETEDAVSIQLSGTSVTAEGTGTAVTDGQLVITAGGTYQLSGTGSLPIVIETQESVRLVFNGVSITAESGPAIDAQQAGEVILSLRTSTANSLSGTVGILCGSGLEISGGGALAVSASEGNGMEAAGSVQLHNAMVTVQASYDGICCTGNLEIRDCILSVNAKEAGLRAGTDDVPSDIVMRSSVITLTAPEDMHAGGEIIQEDCDVMNLSNG